MLFISKKSWMTRMATIISALCFGDLDYIFNCPQSCTLGQFIAIRGITLVRPYIICHMLTSLDGEIIGDYLREERTESFIKEYEERF